MSYKIEKKNPYNKKKVSFKKRIKSTISSIVICGIVITMSGRIQNSYFTSKAEENYSQSISYYQNVVTTTAKFFKENEVDTPEECFELYTKLLWNGYFSNGKTYEYNIKDENNVIGNFGLRVATGEGDCKNNEDFFCKLMNKLGYNAHQVACTQSTNGKIKLSLIENLFGNHVITVVEDNGTVYYFDTTNSCSYELEGVNYAVNTEKNLCIVLKPIISYICGYNKVVDTKNLLYYQLTNSSGNAFVVDDDLSSTMEGSKVLSLRKAIEKPLQGICYSIIKEGGKEKL